MTSDKSYTEAQVRGILSSMRVYSNVSGFHGGWQIDTCTHIYMWGDHATKV